MSEVFLKKYPGVFYLTLLNFLIFALDQVPGLPVESLYLNHQNMRWFQFGTSIFCHFNWAHLTGNLFFLYIFGRLIEEEEGIEGILTSYFVCGVGANLVDWAFSQGNVVSLGASGAIFGLFTISMLIKLKMKLSNLVEVLVLSPFVINHLFGEVSRLGQSDNIAHHAHLYGAATGVFLILSLKYINSKLSKKKQK